MKTSCKRCKKWFLKEDMNVFNSFYFCSKCEIRRAKMQPFIDMCDFLFEEEIDIKKLKN